MKKNTIISVLAVAVLVISGIIGSACFVRMRFSKDLSLILRQAASLKGEAYQHMPIYSDYMTAKRVKKLRTYLLKDHLKVAEDLDLEAAGNRKSIEELIRKKQLMPINRDSTSLFYFYNVPGKNRYLRDFTIKGLNHLGNEFQKTLASRGFSGRVKFAVSSALRGGDYQKSLRRRNINAAGESSHTYGISFDIFFDEYFVVIDKPEKSPFSEKAVLDSCCSQTGYFLGGALRRQFKAAMAETLIRLQDEGRLYAILEKRQRCFHVTVLK